MQLFDGRGEPSFGEFLGRELALSEEACFAIRRIRLARLDLSSMAWAGLRRCRVLLSRLDADSLDFGRLAPARAAAFLELATSGKLDIRAAGLAAWEPDFSVLGRHGYPRVVIVGCHRFAAVEPTEGPYLACATRDPAVARAALARFEEIWSRGYDALEAVIDSLGRSQLEHDREVLHP